MSLRQTPRAPSRRPLVLPLLLGIFSLQALCLPALPVLFVAGAVLRWRGWRPGRVALAAAAVLLAEVGLFGRELASLHFSGWSQFSVAHPLRVLPARMIVEAPVGIPLGILLGALVVLHGEHNAAGADWHPATQRKHARERAHTGRQASRQLERHREDPTLPQLGVLLHDLGLSSWIAGRYVIVPPELRGLGQVVIGMPSMGKTVTLIRLVYLAAKQGRQVIFLDCKGTDPRLPELVAAAYRMANPHARVYHWPQEPFDLWRGSPAEISNKLLGTQVFATQGGGVWYADLAARAVQLAVEAPTGPPRSSAEFLARLHTAALRQLWQQADDPATAQAALLDLDAFQDHELRGVRLKFATFFHSLRGRFDGAWAWEDTDLAICTIPAMAKRDADAVVRALIEDLRYYLLDPGRKPREGKDVTCIVDEFSAVHGATEQTIDLAERARDVGGQCVLAAQTAQGLGNPEQRAQLLGACTGGVFLFRTPDPEPFLAHAGTIRVPEYSWQLDQWGPTGQAKTFMADRPLVDPNHVRQAPPLHGYILQAGRAAYYRVLFAPGEPDPIMPGTILRTATTAAAAQGAALDGDTPTVALPADEPAGALPTVSPTLPLTAQPLSLPAPASPAAAVVGEALPATPPGYRLRLALATAVAERNQAKVAELIALGQASAPAWDATAELRQLRRAHRLRRAPALLRWLAHSRRRAQ
jgi:hypothetical protein